MSFDKTIRIFLFDGNPNGRLMCELSNWNGRAYKIPRSELTLFSDREDSKNTGVYFLFGKDEDANDTIYIGESEQIFVRLKDHVKDHEYWTDCVVLISKDNNLNKAHVKYLESKFFTLAKEVNRFKIVNANNPTLSSLSEYDVAELDEFISHAKLLVNTLGYKAFDLVTDLKPTFSLQKDFFAITATRGADAKGLIVSDGFAVLKDSVIACSVTPSFSPSLAKLRQKILTEGIVDDSFTFVQDYVFTSPSLAAAIVMGRNANGRTEWKNTEKQSIKDIEESL